MKPDRKYMVIGSVRVFDEVECSKAQAVKVLEEAAEAVEAWKAFDSAHGMGDDPACGVVQGCTRLALADELADVVQAACNLAAACGISMRVALERCERRNRERGRITG